MKNGLRQSGFVSVKSKKTTKNIPYFIWKCNMYDFNIVGLSTGDKIIYLYIYLFIDFHM